MTQQQRDAANMKARHDKEARAKSDYYQRLNALTSLAGLSKRDYRNMRTQQFYEMPRNTENPQYHRREQQLIKEEYYENLNSKWPVCPQKAPDFAHMRQHAYFKDALWITEKLGLHPLMAIQQDYNIHVVQQFFATLVFGTGVNRPMTWMTGDMRCQSDFHQFASLLGYEFRGANTALGRRMHIEGQEYNKKQLLPLYLNPKHVGKAKGLSTLGNTLLRLFRETVAPKAGNLDDLRSGVINLLGYAHKIYIRGEDKDAEPIDVMDFVFNEIWLCLIHKCLSMLPM
jgi:hypothetical protein